MSLTGKSALMAAVILSTCTDARGQTPVYNTTVYDYATGDNCVTGINGKRYWTIDPGADNYQKNFYERPTAQDYRVRKLKDGSNAFAANQYNENLDITRARFGFDNTYLYVSISLFGHNKLLENGSSSSEGLLHRYGFRIAQERDGAGGFLFLTDQASHRYGSSFARFGTEGYEDINGSVGGSGSADGLDITKEDDPTAAIENGYEQKRIFDGIIKGGACDGAEVLFARIEPTDPNTIEFALKYSLFGYTAGDLGSLAYLEVNAMKGSLGDPLTYQWNDAFSKIEAGSPYRATTGNTSRSEFGTQGLGGINACDTLQLVHVPEPGTGSLILLGLGVFRRRSRRRDEHGHRCF